MRISSEKVGQKDVCHMNAVLFQSWKGRKLWMCAYVRINLCKSLGKQRGTHTRLNLVILRMRLEAGMGLFLNISLCNYLHIDILILIDVEFTYHKIDPFKSVEGSRC